MDGWLSTGALRYEDREPEGVKGICCVVHRVRLRGLWLTPGTVLQPSCAAYHGVGPTGSRWPEEPEATSPQGTLSRWGPPSVTPAGSGVIQQDSGPPGLGVKSQGSSHLFHGSRMGSPPHQASVAHLGMQTAGPQTLWLGEPRAGAVLLLHGHRPLRPRTQGSAVFAEGP